MSNTRYGKPFTSLDSNELGLVHNNGVYRKNETTGQQIKVHIRGILSENPRTWAKNQSLVQLLLPTVYTRSLSGYNSVYYTHRPYCWNLPRTLNMVCSTKLKNMEHSLWDKCCNLTLKLNLLNQSAIANTVCLWTLNQYLGCKNHTLFYLDNQFPTWLVHLLVVHI